MIDEFGNKTDEDTADVGGLAVYNDPNVQSSVASRKKASDDYKAYYDNMALELSKKRYGPSFSERMFQLSAAFATPTKRRGLSAVLANVSPVLAAQQQAKREGEISRQEALDKLQGNRLAQLAALANQDVTTSVAMARLKAAANKGLEPKYALGPDGKWRIQPGTGSSPPMNARGQYVVSTLAEANMVPTGAEFVYATDTSNKVHWGK